MTAVPAQPPAVPEELVERAADRIALHYGAKPPKRSVLLHHARIALAAVADDLRAEGRPPVCRDGCQLHAMLADAEQRRAEPGTRDDPMVLVERLGLGERFRAEARRECAAEAEAALHPWYDAQTRLQELIERWKADRDWIAP